MKKTFRMKRLKTVDGRHHTAYIVLVRDKPGKFIVTIKNIYEDRTVKSFISKQQRLDNVVSDCKTELEKQDSIFRPREKRKNIIKQLRNKT